MFTGSGNGGNTNSNISRINQTPFGLGGPAGPFSAHHQQQQAMLLPPHPNLNLVHHHHLHPPPPLISSPVSIGSGGSSGGGGGGNEEDEFPRRDERFPKWGIQETREFIAIRVELEAEFTATKRHKALWEVVAAKMREKGYYRTPLQCCTRWKNLITNFKEETINPDYGSHCPFSEELHEFFAAKEKQLLLDTEEAGSSKGRKRVRTASGGQSSEELYEGKEEKNESDEDRVAKGSTAQRKKIKKEKHQQMIAAENPFRQPNMSSNNNTANALNGIQEILRGFIQQQHKIEMKWMESMEKRSQERELFEQEWRHSMEKIERERLMMEQAWREREEQRRMREESRAEKRDALLTALLNKLIHD